MLSGVTPCREKCGLWPVVGDGRGGGVPFRGRRQYNGPLAVPLKRTPSPAVVQLSVETSPPVVIIGAGLAGLSCAVELHRRKIPCQVLEATDRIGGRLRSDVVDGFTLDFGFQVLLTAYPACRERLDLAGLRLRSFEPGAVVRHRGGFATLGDPWRRPGQLFKTAFSPIGTLGDKLRIAALRRASCRGSLDELYTRPHEPTIDRLRRLGFSSPFVEQFFRPFLGGVFLDPSLQTSSRMLEFVFRMFAQGDIAIPADGMAAIPRQLADKLPRGTIRLQHTVETIKDGTLYLTGDQSIKPRRIVLAVESTAAAALLGDETIDTPWHQNVTHYFAAPQSPDRRKMLILAGDEYADPDNDPHAIPDRPIGTVAILSDIAPEYAPPGQALISVTSRQPATWNVSGPGLEVVRKQLAQWFGPAVQQWRHLRSYSVPYGLPTLTLDQVVRSPAYGEFVLCGDYLETPSIQGALNSGVRAAALIASS